MWGSGGGRGVEQRVVTPAPKRLFKRRAGIMHTPKTHHITQQPPPQGTTRPHAILQEAAKESQAKAAHTTGPGKRQGTTHSSARTRGGGLSWLVASNKPPTHPPTPLLHGVPPPLPGARRVHAAARCGGARAGTWVIDFLPAARRPASLPSFIQSPTHPFPLLQYWYDAAQGHFLLLHARMYRILPLGATEPSARKSPSTHPPTHPPPP